MAEFADILDHCTDIAFDAASKRRLKPEQMAYLNHLDLDLKRLTRREDAPIVADIHTDSNSGQVVEEALAHPIAVTANGARGALFQHREFKQPMDHRLTDEEWAQQLDREKKR
jgi:hypothetical protein